jgi:hypothetical protein
MAFEEKKGVNCLVAYKVYVFVLIGNPRWPPLLVFLHAQ